MADVDVRVQRKRMSPASFAILNTLTPEMVVDIVKTIRRKARREVKVDTGDMRKSIKQRFNEDNTIGEVFTQDPGATAQEFGRRGKPFFRPARQTGRKKIRRELRKIMKEMKARGVK